jgi:hypothetical protein
LDVPREAAGEDRRMNKTRGVILCAAITICPALYSFQFTSFLHVKEAALCLAVCALGFFSALAKRSCRAGFAAFTPLWFFVLIAMAGASVTGAPVLSDVATKAASWFLLLLGAGFAFDMLGSPQWRARTLVAIELSTVLVAALGILQYAGVCPVMFPVFEQYTQRVYSVFGNQDFFGGYLAIGAPLLLHAVRFGQFRERFWGTLALAILTPGILISGSRTAWFAALIGCVLAMLARPRNKNNTQNDSRGFAIPFAILFAAASLTVALAPDATLKRVASVASEQDRGVQARLWMWRGALDIIGDGPVLGMGLNSFGYWSPRYLGEKIQGPQGNPHILGEFHADQPHCEILRILSETGLIGLACWIWMTFRVGRAVFARHFQEDVRSPVVGALTALAVFSLFNGVLDSAPHIFNGLILAAILLEPSSAERSKTINAGQTITISAAALAFIVAAFLAVSVYIPSFLLCSAEDAYLDSRENIFLYERVTHYPWPNAKARKEYGFALAEAGRNKDAERELLSALEGTDTGDIYLALAIVAVENGDNVQARKWAEECLLRWPGNPEAKAISKGVRHKSGANPPSTASAQGR